MATRRKNAILLATNAEDTNAAKSFRNMGNVEVMKATDLNPVAVLSYKYVVITNPEKSSAALAARMGK
jgi:ribosomal protein L4